MLFFGGKEGATASGSRKLQILEAKSAWKIYIPQCILVGTKIELTIAMIVNIDFIHVQMPIFIQ